jgi:hypothetical protein
MFLVLGIIILAGLVIVEAIRRFVPDPRELSQTVGFASDK